MKTLRLQGKTWQNLVRSLFYFSCNTGLLWAQKHIFVNFVFFRSKYICVSKILQLYIFPMVNCNLDYCRSQIDIKSWASKNTLQPAELNFYGVLKFHAYWLRNGLVITQWSLCGCQESFARFARYCTYFDLTAAFSRFESHKGVFPQARRDKTRRGETAIEICMAKFQCFPRATLVELVWIGDDVRNVNWNVCWCNIEPQRKRFLRWLARFRDYGMAINATHKIVLTI